jgi:hypothetical protein
MCVDFYNFSDSDRFFHTEFLKGKLEILEKCDIYGRHYKDSFSWKGQCRSKQVPRSVFHPISAVFVSLIATSTPEKWGAVEDASKSGMKGIEAFLAKQHRQPDRLLLLKDGMLRMSAARHRLSWPETFMQHGMVFSAVKIG